MSEQQGQNATKGPKRPFWGGDFVHTLKVSCIPATVMLLLSVAVNYCLGPYSARRVDEPTVVIRGVQPFAIRYKRVSGEIITRTDQLGFIFKLEHLGGVETAVEFALVDGCAGILPEIAGETLGDGLTEGNFVEQINRMHERYGSARQRVRASATVAAGPADRVLKAHSVGYFPFTFDFPTGGAWQIIPGSVAVDGNCSDALTINRNPNTMQFFENWSAVRLPDDIGRGFRDGHLSLSIQVGRRSLKVGTAQIGKMLTIRRESWDSLDFHSMFENPDTDYPPRRMQ